MVLHLNRANDITDHLRRPVATSLTAQEAADFLRAHSADLPAYVEARFHVEPLAPVPLARQMAKYERRLRAIGAGCGRSLVRVEPDFINGHRMAHTFRALLAR